MKGIYTYVRVRKLRDNKFVVAFGSIPRSEKRSVFFCNDLWYVCIDHQDGKTFGVLDFGDHTQTKAYYDQIQPEGVKDGKLIRLIHVATQPKDILEGALYRGGKYVQTLMSGS
jgi:hypothetical protein